jgi:hypothetical protein
MAHVVGHAVVARAIESKRARHLGYRPQRGVPQHVVVQYVEAIGEQVGPVGGFVHFEQAAPVGVLIAQPQQRLLQRLPLFAQEVDMA